MNLINKIANWYFTKNALPYWVVLILDCLICFISGIFVFWLYGNGSTILSHFVSVINTILVFMIFSLIGFRLFHTYAGVFRYSSFVDLQRIGLAMMVSCLIALVMHYPMYYYHEELHFFPLPARPIIAMYVVATILMWAIRVIIKTVYDVAFSSGNGLRTLIYGVRSGGIGLAKNIRNQKPARFQLKGFITNEEHFKGKILLGEKVYEASDHEALKNLIKDINIQAVLISPLQNEPFRKDTELQDLLIENNVKIFMSAETREWTNESDFSSVQLKEITVDDLLPRSEIKVDMDAVGKLLKGKKILISGSAGSIGSEIVRQIANYKPASLMLIDIAETPQHDVRLNMNAQWPDIDTHTIVGSITNLNRMRMLFSEFRPDYVFHAAAYKHVPMMEDNPSESVQNNIYGTQVLADLSVEFGVKKFVMLSTDKAVNPTNVMGCSKRICEIYVQSLDKVIKLCQDNPAKMKEYGIKTFDGKPPITQFVTTRFGNVLGSNGSVIPLFEKQIKNGGPVTVTDPNIIRFFMLIPEACKLVLEAGTHGKGGEIFVFDMGSPVKIADLAKRMIRLSGAKGVKVEFTGLRPGEKLYEEVLSNDENTKESFHDKIRIAMVREYDYNDVRNDVAELIRITQGYDDMAIVAKMKSMVPEYVSNNSVFSELDKTKKDEV